VNDLAGLEARRAETACFVRIRTMAGMPFDMETSTPTFG